MAPDKKDRAKYVKMSSFWVSPEMLRRFDELRVKLKRRSGVEVSKAAIIRAVIERGLDAHESDVVVK